MTGRVLDEMRTIHVHGSSDEQLAQFPESPGSRMGLGAQLNTPLLRRGQAIGVFALTRRDSRPFTDGEIALFETFADQAVIAIENARLFSELQEQLERQSATAEVLQAISRSPTDVQRVLDTIAESAARLCGAENVAVWRREGAAIRVVARQGWSPIWQDGHPDLPPDAGPSGRRTPPTRNTGHRG